MGKRIPHELFIGGKSHRLSHFYYKNGVGFWFDTMSNRIPDGVRDQQKDIDYNTAIVIHFNNSRYGFSKATIPLKEFKLE